MWGALAKLGGAILATIGIDYAVDSYKESKAEEVQDAKEATFGKYVILAAALFFGYKLLTKK
ncbi:MAG: hypothetical protein IJ525_03695 [Alphaproteobacteria bacterium]|nr:hypothetical protein [Alphaproteobacteria bacterium]